MKKIINKVEPRHIREVIVYGAVGGFSWVVQTICYVLFVHLHVFPSIAMIIGSTAGMITSYFGHVRFTFQKTHKFSHNEFVKFMITSIIGLVFNVLGVRVVTKILHLNPHYAIIPTIFTPALTFLISKFWAFR